MTIRLPTAQWNVRNVSRPNPRARVILPTRRPDRVEIEQKIHPTSPRTHAVIRCEVRVNVEVSARQRLMETSAIHAWVADETVEARRACRAARRVVTTEGLGDLLKRWTPRVDLPVRLLPFVEMEVADPPWIVGRGDSPTALVKHIGRQNVVEDDVRERIGHGVLKAEAVRSSSNRSNPVN